jgi:hypothetical protein
VFETNAQYVKWEFDYSEYLKDICGIIPYGNSFEELYHLIFDKNGSVYKHNVYSETENKPELLF